MINIYKTILFIYKEKFHRSSKEFRAGFHACLIMLETGIKKSTSYNLSVKVDSLLSLNNKLKKENRRLRNEIREYKNRINEASFINDIPTADFNEYELDTKIGKFNIVLNASRETLLALFFSFASNNTFNTVNECKSKFMTFLGRLNSRGFIAYKDMKTAIKEMENDNQ